MSRIFVSYSRVDCSFTMKLVERLRRLYGYSYVWLDTELHGGDVWWEKILDEIAACDIFMYLISEHSVGSPYCRAEYTEASRLRKAILPVLISERAKIPANLSHIQYVDLSRGLGDEGAIDDLYASIRELEKSLPRTRPRPRWKERTPSPDVPSEDEETQIALKRVEFPPASPVKVSARLSWRWWLGGVMILVLLVTTALVIFLSGSGDASPALSTQIVTRDDLSPSATAQFPTTSTPEIAHTFPPTATFAPMEEVWARVTQTVETAWTPVAYNADWTPVVREIGGIELVLVPAGCFTMGSTEEQYQRAVEACVEADNSEEDCVSWISDELPAHQVCFDEPYWLGRYEVTNAQYQQCVEAGACEPLTDVFNAVFYKEDHPAIGISWFNARQYVQWLNKTTDGSFCLPTEAQWEYAARGPDSWIYPWGNEFVGNNAVYAYNANGHTHPVGSKPGGASWVGAMDMSGNAWEWTSTIYRDYPYRADDGRENLDDTLYPRVARGGSWSDEGANGSRSAARIQVNGGVRVNYLGMRVCWSLSE